MAPGRWALTASTPPMAVYLEDYQMSMRRKYKKKATSFITAVQLDLDTEGFVYDKWGGKQICKRGDWLVDNNGDTYTVSQDAFASTYELVSPGVYKKSTPVWAEIAERAGKIQTSEGATAYEPGDYLVYNNEDGKDAYAVSAHKFESMYEPVQENKGRARRRLPSVVDTLRK
jgi:hypothetical protein